MTKGDALGYYEILGVPQEAGAETIKQQYYVLAKKWHPDHNEDERAAEIFQKISIAYNILKEEDSRLKYDLLSQVYEAKHFPDMDNLKVYNNRAGYPEIDLRHIKLTKVTGKLVSHTETEVKEICNYKEAKKLVLKVSLHNWLLGWWSVTGIIANIKAIMKNYQKALYDFEGNFTLLTHNMMAYAQEKKYNEAYASGRLALRYANPRQKELVEQFMATIPYERDYIFKQWKSAPFRAIQLIIPALIGLEIILMGSTKVLTMEEFNNLWASRNNIDYFQEVRFNSGARTVDDMVVSKVVAIPVDTEDYGQLYHLTQDTKVMYGPNVHFDVLKKLPAQTTVRLTGYTPDEQWARIMIDNGEMGFVLIKEIKKGIGKEVPEDSQILTGVR